MEFVRQAIGSEQSDRSSIISQNLTTVLFQRGIQVS